MKRLLFCAAAGAALLALCGVSERANAATITFVSSSSGAGTLLSANNSGPQTIVGFATGPVALSFSTDWVEFYVIPSTDSMVTVTDLQNTNYPNEQWEITDSGGTVVAGGGPFPANNTTVTVNIPLAGPANDFFLRLNSDIPSNTGGASLFSLTVPTPLPGALGLFAGGLGLLGAAGLRRRKKAERSLHT